MEQKKCDFLHQAELARKERPFIWDRNPEGVYAFREIGVDLKRFQRERSSWV